jgi:ubiquinone/menaquinone biosynthesis C-methylase UbiE
VSATADLPAWDADAYAANTAHHRTHDGEFLAGLPVRPADHLLDLGCGSGDFTASLAALVPEGHVVGLDAQPGMVEHARGMARPNQSFVVAPMQALDATLTDDGMFDGVLSRAALHWLSAPDHQQVLRSARRHLRPGGWLRDECGGHGNVRAVEALLDEISAAGGGSTAPWTFVDAATELEWLEAAGFTIAGGWVRVVAQRRSFDRAQLIGWLRSQCYQAYGGRPALRAATEARIDELCRRDGTFDQTFARLDVLAWRCD